MNIATRQKDLFMARKKPDSPVQRVRNNRDVIKIEKIMLANISRATLLKINAKSGSRILDKIRIRIQLQIVKEMECPICTNNKTNKGVRLLRVQGVHLRVALQATGRRIYLRVNSQMAEQALEIRTQIRIETEIETNHQEVRLDRQDPQILHQDRRDLRDRQFHPPFRQTRRNHQKKTKTEDQGYPERNNQCSLIQADRQIQIGFGTRT
jgi:hypothetical protein